MMNNFKIFSLIVFFLLVSCQSQTKIPDDPILFVDSSGKVIDHVLILPRYGHHTGVSTGVGHGPEKMEHKIVLANPLIYKNGKPFTPKQPLSKGILIPFIVFAGKGISLDGFVAVTHAYMPKWISRSDINSGKIILSSIDEQTSKKELERLLISLSRGSFEISGKDLLWNLNGNFTVEIQFTEAENKMVRSFLDLNKK
jgi:hypothetical protein